MSERLAVRAGMQVLAQEICLGCEEETALPGDRYCKWCGVMKEALEERYANRPKKAASALFAVLPRQNVGVVTIGQAMSPLEMIRRDPKLRQLCAAGVVMFGFILSVLCVLGWLGMLLLTQIDIWFAGR